MKILVTGGAGFIGSHLVDALVERGHDVIVYDNLDPQVHGPSGIPPDYLSPEARFVRADVRNETELRRWLLRENVEAVFHEAAVVGVGQSMYEIRRYVDVNSLGTAALLDVLANSPNKVRKLVVASSMSIYGEGAYRCRIHGSVFADLRKETQLNAGKWELFCPKCGSCLAPEATRENKALAPTSTYATTKRDQEELVLQFGLAYRVPTVALRYFNVYGPRQSLSNPYTGVAAIFASRLMAGSAPLIFEDGQQTRDFVHVSDIVSANLAVLDDDGADHLAVNVGSGSPVTIAEVAHTLARQLALDLPPRILGEFRVGDIRHCVADVSRMKSALNFQAHMTFQRGMSELTDWLQEETAVDRSAEAIRELRQRGLSRPG